MTNYDMDQLGMYEYVFVILDGLVILAIIHDDTSREFTGLNELTYIRSLQCRTFYKGVTKQGTTYD